LRMPACVCLPAPRNGCVCATERWPFSPTGTSAHARPSAKPFSGMGQPGRANMSSPLSILWGEVLWSHIGPYSGLRPLSRLLDARHPGAIRRIASTRPAASPFSVARRKLQNLLHPYPEWMAIRDSALPLYTPEAWRMEIALCKTADAHPPDLIVVEGA